MYTFVGFQGVTEFLLDFGLAIQSQTLALSWGHLLRACMTSICQVCIKYQRFLWLNNKEEGWQEKVIN